MKHRKVNKIIVRHCVKFYNECWKDRNNIMHDEEKQKVRLSEWFEKEKSKAEQSECRQILCAERCKVNVNRCTCNTIKRWIRNLKRIEKKVEKLPSHDIRRWMVM